METHGEDNIAGPAKTTVWRTSSIPVCARPRPWFHLWNKNQNHSLHAKVWTGRAEHSIQADTGNTEMVQ